MADQHERTKANYERMRDSEDYDYQCVTFEFPTNESGQPYRQETGYTTAATIAGEPAVKILDEDILVEVPLERVIYLKSVEEPSDE